MRDSSRVRRQRSVSESHPARAGITHFNNSHATISTIFFWGIEPRIVSKLAVLEGRFGGRQ
jgi:hypothetical protein